MGICLKLELRGIQKKAENMVNHELLDAWIRLYGKLDNI